MVERPEWFSPDPSETVVWTGKPRVRRVLPTAAGAAFWSLVALGVAWALVTYGPETFETGLPVPAVAVWGLALVVVAAQAAWAALAYLRVRATDYVLTDRNVYKKTGVLSEHVTRVRVDRIQNTTLRKSLTGNLFDWGTVLLSTASGAATELAVTDLDDPETFQDELQRLIARTGATGEDRTGGRSEQRDALDAATVEAMIPEARRLRESAERLESHYDA